MVELNVMVETIAKAIATEEGFYKTKAKIEPISQRLNNPGCLDHWKDKNGRPYPTVNGYVNFPNEALGFSALRSQAKINIVKRKLTFLEFFSGKSRVYAGMCPRSKDSKDPAVYAGNVLSFVCRALHFGDEVKLDTPIHTLVVLPSVPVNNVLPFTPRKASRPVQSYVPSYDRKAA